MRDGVLGWLVTGGSAYKDRLFLDPQQAQACLADRGDGSRLIPLGEVVIGGGLAAHSDDHAVDRFAQAMKQKLAKKREQGYCGWEKMDAAELSLYLEVHVVKGDPVDVANLAMMLHQNGYKITKADAAWTQGKHQDKGKADV